MCGISGIYSSSNKLTSAQIEGAVDLMNKSQEKRGPDDFGTYSHQSGKESVCFGHRRLSIIDLSPAGHQPMMRQSIRGKGKLVITFNGEIYNFLELKKELIQKGHVFISNSDTEVLLALYDEHGADFVKKLRGMFAFSLWSEGENKILLARDHFGIKPLYYYLDKEKTIFASTVNAIKNSGLIENKINKDAKTLFLLFGSIPEPHTTQENIYALRAGYYLEIDSSGNTKETKYYDLLDYFINKTDISFNKASEKVRNILQDSVSAHMISDAPLGVFLSGGTDSSVISLLASSSRKEPITTLSIDFEEQEFSERKYQDIIQNKIKSNHKKIVVKKNDFEKSFDDFFEAMDQPSIDGVNTYFVSKAAKGVGLTVVLSGLGSDEIFYGYSGFRRFGFVRIIAKMPKIAKFWLSWLSLFGGRYSKLSYLKYSDFLRSYLVIRGLFTPKEVSKLLQISQDKVENTINKFLSTSVFSDPRLYSLDSKDVFSYLELNTYMRSQLLKDSDFMSMRHSLEIRVPFVDKEVIEFIASLSPKIKSYGKYNKGLLIDAVKDILPEKIYNRPKMGFTFPFKKWILESKRISKLSDLVKGHWSKKWAFTVLERKN